MNNEQKITCKTCGRENAPDWDGEGRCITCARDRVLAPAERAELERYRKQRMIAIEDYHEFGKAPVGSPERMAAYVSHLSPWNLRAGADALKQWREERWPSEPVADGRERQK